MNQDELNQAARMSVYAVLDTSALWKFLLEQGPEEAIAAEVVGQAVDALIDVSNTLMDRLGVPQ